jgi:hypothetical protein
MTIEEYYTAPPQKIFDDIKKNAIKIWNTYDNLGGYRDEKLNMIKDLKNIKDNAWFMVGMFDFNNKIKLISRVKTETARMILDAMQM